MTSNKPVKLAYKIFEPAGGADNSLSPIIFLHGLTATKEMWKDLPQLIADKSKRKAYALDARNHGDSEFSNTFNFEVNADDLLHFMETMNISKAVLVGHSMGGVTSIRAALKCPEKVDMLFSEDMYVKKFPKEIIDLVLGFIGLFLAGVLTTPPDLTEKEAKLHIVDFVFDKLPPEKQNMFPKEKMYEMPLKLRQNPNGTYDVSYNKEIIIHALKNYDAETSEPSGQYDGPAFFLYGSVSPFCVGSEEENIKKHFPKAELIEFEGANHNVHDEFENKYIDVIVKRLQN